MGYDEISEMLRRFRREFKELEDYIMKTLRDEVYRLYEDLASIERMFRPMWHHEGYLEPLYSVKDLGDRIVVYIDLPYAEEGSIDVKFVDNKMIIKARLKDQLSYSGWGTRFERMTFNEYRTVIDLPIVVDPNKIRIRSRKGLVEITIFK
ncbi:MAG TPA: Hsp20/alpha crystallin family protein [Ignisphaera sp.]|uniref:Hsp20/alpha crystallin family protein n=1 Tax=Ignisphaera aggregans TaxID=334771 RepID=A0A832YTP1_9CREN|nr:Hsp20/alpha crystallin family protein [Ignisphaera sp.]HIP57585.1 Hsp20/alpha crystallin family protein [Ignisphaera aggregans]